MVITLLQVYNEKIKQAGQKEIQNIQYMEKKITRQCNAGAKACAERDKKPDEKWSKGTDTFGEDPTKSILQFRKKRVQGVFCP